VSVAWLALQSTVDGDDELVTAHLQENQKIRNIRRDSRVALTFVSTDRSGPFPPYLSIKGTARVEEGGAPELLAELTAAMFGPGTNFPPPDAPPGYVTASRSRRSAASGPGHPEGRPANATHRRRRCQPQVISPGVLSFSRGDGLAPRD
jgi:hypothetical protein